MICLVDILIVSNLFSVTSNAGFIVKCVVGTIKHFKIANIHHFPHILHQVMPAIFLRKKKASSASRTLIQNFEEAGDLSRTQGPEMVNLFFKANPPSESQTLALYLKLIHWSLWIFNPWSHSALEIVYKIPSKYGWKKSPDIKLSLCS